MEKLRKNQGITLIALVITIIVLLILAAVVIVTLTGENGILTKTNQAKKETTDATAEEKVKIAVLGSYGKDGKINYEELQNNLNEVEGIDKQTIPDSITEESFPLTIRVDGIQVEITAEGEVSLAFNAEEWDKTATPEDCFQWGSNTKGQDGYDVIIGYTEKLEPYSKVRIPSRCKKIICDGTYHSIDQNTNEGIGRSFFSNVEKVELPSTVTEIGNIAFGKMSGSITSSLQEITIPNSVTRIGRNAFSSCSNLSSITIPNSVTSIEYYAFSSCSNLSSITIPDSVTSIGSGAFSYCSNLSSITIPNSVTSIGSDAFYYCSNLSSITIGNSVTSIGDYAFNCCTGLSSIIIPDSVTTIGACAFRNWTENQTIKCRASGKPEGWSSEWDYYDDGVTRKAQLEWGYTGE